MITLTAGDLGPALAAIQELVQVGGAQSVRISLQCRRIAKALRAELETVGEAEAAVLREYGALEDDAGFVPESDDQPGTVVFKDDANRRPALAALSALRKEPVELAVRPLSARELVEVGFPITGVQVFQLGELLSDDLDQEEAEDGEA